MRNAVKQAQTGRAILADNRDLTAGELSQLFELYGTVAEANGHGEGLWQAVTTAFYFGYAVGKREGEENSDND